VWRVRMCVCDSLCSPCATNAVQGGELFSRLQNSSTPGRVSVNDARFYGGCVLDAFEHMHARR
jgi:hypothetical protein